MPGGISNLKKEGKVSLWLKSILSVVMLAQAILALYTMWEIMGREKSPISLQVLRRIHLINGYVFIILFLGLSYYCLPFLRASPEEISARALLHSLFAIGVILMLVVKILFVKRYKKFMRQVPAFGLTIFFLTAGLVATSGGYYFVVSAKTLPKSQVATQPKTDQAAEAKLDQAKVKRGKELFNKWCLACHYTDRTETRMGPGLKGILKKEKLPASGQAATPDNIRRQMRTPYRFMPPQTHLSDEEIDDIIEFLKTL